MQVPKFSLCSHSCSTCDVVLWIHFSWRKKEINTRCLIKRSNSIVTENKSIQFIMKTHSQGVSSHYNLYVSWFRKLHFLQKNKQKIAYFYRGFFVRYQSLKIILRRLWDVCSYLETSHNDEKSVIFRQPELPDYIWIKTYIKEKQHLKLKYIFLLLVKRTKA